MTRPPRPPPVQGPAPAQGFALILVLWVLSLMIIMAASFALSMRRETAIVDNLKRGAEAVAIAESGVAIAELMLGIPDRNKRWRSDGSIYQVASHGVDLRIRVLSESGKIDINAAGEPLLAALLANAPVEPVLARQARVNLVSAIIDWRDSDDLLYLNGAERRRYQEAGLNYGPRNKPFQSVEELRLVLGMDQATYQWLAPLVTVHSRQPRVNMALASAEVLYVLPNVDRGLLPDYLAARLGSAQQDLPPPPLPPGLTAPGAQGGGGGAEASQVVTIDSQVVLADGGAARVVATVELGADGGQLLDWQHDTVGELTLFADGQPDTFNAGNWIVKHYVEPKLVR